MKTNKEVVDNFGKLSEEEINNLIAVKDLIEKFLETNEINSGGLRDLENIENDIKVLRNKYYWRYIHLLKQKNILN